MKVLVRLLSCLWVANAYPQMLIDPNKLNGNGKCSSLTVPASTIVHVSYDILQEKVPTKNKKMEDPSSPKQLEKETDIMMNNLIEIVIEPIPKEDNEKKNTYKKSRTTLQKMTDYVEYVTDKSFEGHLQICVVNNGTTQPPQQQPLQKLPAFISLRIKLSASTSLLSKKRSKTHLTIGEEDAKQAVVEHSLEYLANEIQQLTNEMALLHVSADGIKIVESDLFLLSTEMNSAASWWPVIRLIILVITGLTQAHHMIDFFRKHHVI